MNLAKATAAVPALCGMTYFLLKQQRTQQQNAQAQEQTLGNWLNSGFCNIPHYKKRDIGGEDGWISAENLIVVADGVGGWNNKGVNPGIFTRELCRRVLTHYQNSVSQKKRYEMDLWELLVSQVRQCKAIGTCTFVMGLLDESDPHMRVLNLGDSGYMLLRRASREHPYETVFRSEERQYKFNHPYQCGTNYKLPYHADVYFHQVKDKDVVIMGTDGLFDNLFEKDVLQCLEDSTRGTLAMDQTKVATCLATKAEKLSFDKKYDSPFAKNARDAGRKHPGGKKDDITVIVSEVNIRSQ